MNDQDKPMTATEVLQLMREYPGNQPHRSRLRAHEDLISVFVRAKAEILSHYVPALYFHVLEQRTTMECPVVPPDVQQRLDAFDAIIEQSAKAHGLLPERV